MSAEGLDPAARDRLLKLLGMLGSDHDGERAAAGLMADRLVRGLGLTWGEVLHRPPAVRPDPGPRAAAGVGGKARRWRPTLTAQATARQCLECPELLSPKELDFCASLARWRGAPAPRQLAWLARIEERIGEGGYAW